VGATRSVTIRTMVEAGPADLEAKPAAAAQSITMMGAGKVSRLVHRFATQARRPDCLTFHRAGVD
jgi:hypothetical protein